MTVHRALLILMPAGVFLGAWLALGMLEGLILAGLAVAGWCIGLGDVLKRFD